MFQPKFNIGDEVYSKEFGINYAIIAGLKIFYQHNYKQQEPSPFPMTLVIWSEYTNNCDYEIMYENNDGVLIRDCLSERFLEKYE